MSASHEQRPHTPDGNHSPQELEAAERTVDELFRLVGLPRLVPSDSDPPVDCQLISAYARNAAELTDDQKRHVLTLSARHANWARALLDALAAVEQKR